MDGQGAADWGLNGVKKKIKRSKPAFFDVYGGWSKDARSLFPEVAPILTKGGHFPLHFPLNLGFFIEWDGRFSLLHQRPPWAGVPRPTRRLSSHLRLVEGGRKPKSVTEAVEDWGMSASNAPTAFLPPPRRVLWWKKFELQWLRANRSKAVCFFYFVHLCVLIFGMEKPHSTPCGRIGLV